MSFTPVPNPISTTPIPPGGQYVRRFGFNPTVGTSQELIDALGAPTPYMPTTAAQIEVFSASASDTAAGVGARTVLITGLDANFNQITDTIALNGVTPVASTLSFIRVTKAEVIHVGAYGAHNVGQLTVRRIGGGTTFLIVVAGHGQSFSSHFCVPAGYYGAISGANLSVDSGKYVDIYVRSRDNANIVAAPYHADVIAQIFAGVGGGTVSHFSYEAPILLTPLTDIYITGAVVSGTASVSVEYWGWIFPV